MPSFKAQKLDLSVLDLVRAALAAPVGTSPLAELVKGKQRIAIVVDDLTRPTPRRTAAGCLGGGVGGAGCLARADRRHHRGGTTACSRRPKYSRPLARSLRDCVSATTIATRPTCVGGHFGPQRRGLPEPDAHGGRPAHRLGSILPHPWNGFGGAKLILPGIAGWDTIKRHHPALSPPRGSPSGNLADNPFHEEVYQAGKMSGVDLIVNAVYNANEDVKGVVAGYPEEAYRHGAQLCEQEMGVRFEEGYNT